MIYKNVSFIGGGRITRILLDGLKHANALPEKITVCDPDQKAQQYLQELNIPGLTACENISEELSAEIVFLAIHPPIVKEIMPEIQKNLNSQSILISLAPVIKTSALKQMAGGFDRIVRMIPNAPSIIGQGYNPVCFTDSISSQEKDELIKFFRNWGQAPEVEEEKLEAYAILTAMGPTYFWFQWLKLRELGKQFGLSDVEMNKAMAAMLNGATETLFHSNLPPTDILDLIPVCPLKDDESIIQDIFDKRLTGLHKKLTQK